jgi:hypothetical protein
MKRPKIFVLLMALPAAMILHGCYPDKIDYVDEYDLAGTAYDHAADFSSYATFIVVDTIVHLTGTGEDDPNFSRAHDDEILGLIRDNLTAKGYTEFDAPDPQDKPDLLLFVEALSSDFYQYWGYWWDYWYWYPGWDWWYPGYPWYPSYPWYPGWITSYSTGTLIIEMVDTDRFVPDAESAGVVWMGLVDGLLSGNSTYASQRLKQQIDQLFTQSDYLHQ